MGRGVKDKQYTTFEKSNLYALLNKLKPHILALNKQLATDLQRDNTSFETKFTKKQFEALIKLIDLFERIGPEFTKGKKPGIFGLSRHASSLKELESIKKPLYTTRYAIYKLMLRDKFPDILTSCYNQAKKEHPNQLAEHVRDKLKKAVQSALVGLNKIIPGADATPYLADIEVIIDQYPVTNKAIDTAKFIKHFREKFIKDELTVELKVTHPAAYNLLTQFFLLCEEVPKELEDLLSFFDPAALHISTGIPGLPKISRVESNKSNFMYDSGEGARDYEQFYREYVNLLPSILSAKLVDYFQHYQDSLHVKSERAKMKLISAFLKEENALLIEKVDAILKDNSTLNKNDDAVINSEEEISLEGIVKQLEIEETKIRTLATEIAKRAYHLPFKQLLAEHPTLIEQFRSNPDLDTSYTDHPLPNIVLIEGDSIFQVLHVQDELKLNVEKQQQRLRDYLVEIANRKEKLILQFHQQRNAKFSAQVALLTQDIPPFENLTVSASDNVEQLESKYSLLQKQLVELEKKQATLDNLQFELNQSLNDHNFLKAKITAIYSDSNARLHEAKHSIVEAQKLIEQQLQSISLQLDKATFASSHSQRLSLLKEKEKLLERSSADKQQIEKELAALVEERDNPTADFATKTQQLHVVIEHFLGDITKHKEVILKLRPYSLEKFNHLFAKPQLQSKPEAALDWLREISSDEEKLTQQESKFSDKIKRLEAESKALVAFYHTVEAIRNENNTFGIHSIIPKLKKDPIKEILQLKELQELVEIYKLSVGSEALMTLFKVDSEKELQSKFAHDLESALKDMQTKQIAVNEEIKALKIIQQNNKNKGSLEEIIKPLAQIVENHEDLVLKKEQLAKDIEIRDLKLKELKALETEVATLRKMNELFENNQRVSQTIAEKIQAINIDPSPNSKCQEQFLELVTALEELINLQKSIGSSFEQVDLLLTTVTQITDQKNNENDAARHTKVLEDLVIARQSHCLTKIKALLTAYGEELKREKEKFPMAFEIDNYKALEKSVSSIKAYFNTIKLDVKKLQAILKLHPARESVLPTMAQMELIEQEEERFTAGLKNVESALENIKAEVARRKIEALFKSESENYIKDRAEKYMLKDSLSSKDAFLRKKFLDELTYNQLRRYVTTGDSTSLLNYIAKERVKFSGLTMQSLINRLIIKIKELDGPAYDYHATTHKEALEKLKTASTDFQQVINNLYHKIGLLKTHGDKIGGEEGNIAENLAGELCKKVDIFVLQQADKTDKKLIKEEFQNFNTDFMTCLHSHDEVMSKSRSFWKPFLLNITAALFTVGIALGVKLISSKLRTGHASFFGETKRFQYVQDLDKAVSEVSAAVSA
ncbi:hypothetical protein [Legionella clemsonensis]|uniref:Ankyrin repeat protein n=1 Tax=Legionella clemsonensis TaxID=1867846 RepID=A0A222P2H5_9GAMM|nr:hypothetical protein [Legionella clemsonensis]ASQ45965.1 hypothetical protein clem_07050 [Legionella clemsonensis]